MVKQKVVKVRVDEQQARRIADLAKEALRKMTYGEAQLLIMNFDKVIKAYNKANTEVLGELTKK